MLKTIKTRLFLFIFNASVNNFSKGEDSMNVKIIFSLILCISLFGLLFMLPIGTEDNKTSNADFLRVHIRANSNETVDQNVKYVVKDAVVSYLTPLLCDAVDKNSAMEIVSNNLCGIEKVCDDVLRNQGFLYSSQALLYQEEFPTRSYDNFTLTAGVYDSLIINLGSGLGNNWWCVVYPPLCFVSNDSKNVVYRSKLLEIINSFWGK